MNIPCKITPCRIFACQGGFSLPNDFKRRLKNLNFILKSSSTTTLGFSQKKKKIDNIEKTKGSNFQVLLRLGIIWRKKRMYILKVLRSYFELKYYKRKLVSLNPTNHQHVVACTIARVCKKGHAKIWLEWLAGKIHSIRLSGQDWNICISRGSSIFKLC